MQQLNISKAAEIKVSFISEPGSKPKVTCSSAVYDLLIQWYDPDTIELQESFIVMYLSRSQKVLGIMKHTVGGITSTVVDVRLILATALKTNAVSIILSHNHPSGNKEPSKQDKAITGQIRDAAKLHEIQVLDHLIITKDGYYSFADEGIMCM